MPAPNAISARQLGRLIGTPDCPAIIDICLDEDFASHPFLIPGAVRCRHDEIDTIRARAGTRGAVIVCQKGRKLSQGVTAWLRAEGVRAEYLDGGALGWRDAGGLSLPAAALPALVGGATLWVTRHRPKVDRIACPWLIRRFIDREARFLYVSPDEVAAVAERFGATAFDAEGAALSHRAGRSSFDALCDRFGLHSEPLDRLAEVVRAADLGRNEDHPAAAGLLAVSIGLSRLYRDDTEQLAAGLGVYDALYRWARDGADETHASFAGAEA